MPRVEPRVIPDLLDLNLTHPWASPGGCFHSSSVHSPVACDRVQKGSGRIWRQLLFRIPSLLVIFGQSLMHCMAGREKCRDRFWLRDYIFFFFKGLDSCELACFPLWHLWIRISNLYMAWGQWVSSPGAWRMEGPLSWPWHCCGSHNHWDRGSGTRAVNKPPKWLSHSLNVWTEEVIGYKIRQHFLSLHSKWSCMSLLVDLFGSPHA